jgi:N-acetylglucosamine-6-phosphate deacetylase
LNVTTTLIRGAHLISPGQETRDGSLLIEHGQIAAIFGPDDKLPESDLTLDAHGRMLLPGFIDIHAHGAVGYDVSDASDDALRGIAKAKLAEGVTTWLPTTLTQPAARLEAIAAACARYAANPEFTKTPGVHYEGPFINQSMTGAQNPQFVRPPDVEELRKLHEIAPARVLSLAPEIPGALELIRAARELGVTCSAAHTAADYKHLLDACDAGLTHLTHFCNAMTPLHHREIGVVGAGLLEGRLMLELICDFAHLVPEMLLLIFKCVPLERLMLITDSTSASGMPDGETQLGGLPVVVSGGIARLAENGALAGSTLAFNRGLANVAMLTGLPLGELVATTAWNQARSLGLEKVGKLEPGFAADLVLLDADFSVWKTLVDGSERYPLSS